MSTSQNGWPALASGSPLLHSWKIPGSTRRLRLRNGSAGFVLVHCAMWFDRKVEDIDEGPLDDWGHAYRPVRGYSTTMSNHASGTAMDLNALDHPLGRVDTFKPGQELTIRHRLVRQYDGVIRWGGQYHGRKDEMHFEINQPLRDVEHVARDLLDTPKGRKILAANPGQRAVILS